MSKLLISELQLVLEMTCEMHYGFQKGILSLVIVLFDPHNGPSVYYCYY
jgi:hypothetical protein